MGKVVKLNEFRKRKAKAEREKRAETNRRLHGRTKAERAREELQKQRLTRGLEGARLSKPPDAASEVSSQGPLPRGPAPLDASDAGGAEGEESEAD